MKRNSGIHSLPIAMLAATHLVVAFWSPGVRADLVDPAPHVEDEVNWTVGAMAADPLLNYVYIINETEHKLHALNTATGEVDATAYVDGNTEGGYIDFSIDGSIVYVSCPLSTKVHAFQAGTLTSIWSRTVGVSPRSFVIGSDGFLYAVGADGYLAKIDLANGVKVDSHDDPLPSFPVDKNELSRSADGSRIFVLETDTHTGSGGVTEFSIQTDAMPAFVITHFGNDRFVKDLSVDTSTGQLFRAGGSSIDGVAVWNLTSRTETYWPPSDTWPYMAVTQRPGAANDLWAATDNWLSGRVRRIDKVTGALIHEYQFAGGSTGFDNGRVFDRQLAVTPNGHVVYGKLYPTNGKRYIGLIGFGSITMPQADPADAPPLTHTEKEVNWAIGAVLGDPIRDLTYVVNETGGKVLAVNTATGAVDGEVTLADNVRWGHLALSVDNSTLYLTTPLSRRIHAFDAGTLALQGSLDLQFPAQDFVIGSDGYLYAFWTAEGTHWVMRQIDLTTGFTLAQHTDPADRFAIVPGTGLVQKTGLIERNGDGSRLFVYRGNIDRIVEYAIQITGIPQRSGTHLLPGKTPVEISVDHTRNTLFCATGAPGLIVWQMTPRVETSWPSESPRAEAVAQAPTSEDVFVVGSNDLIRQYNKNGQVRYDYPFRGSGTGFIDTDLIDRSFKVTPNGHMLYGKQDWSGTTGIYVDGYRYYLGMIGPDAIQVPTGSSAPTYPTGVTASDKLFPDKVRITWNSSSSATSYDVYRGTSNQIIDVEKVGTTDTLVFDDLTAVPDVPYRYYVTSNNAAGTSTFSSYDFGTRDLSIPDPPTGVTASDQEHPDWVRVDWEFSPGATGYNVYRNSINNTATATQIATGQSTNSFTDTTAAPFNTFYYWVTATNTLGESQFSSTDTGMRGLLLPEAPTLVSASDDIFTDKVAITWTGGDRTDSFKVFRSTALDENTAVEIGTSNITMFDDTSAVHGTQYYYWVRGVNASGDGPFSFPPDPGMRKIPPPPIPGSFEATEDVFSDKIVLSWEDVGADTYYIYRGLSSDAQGDLLNISLTNSFTDTEVSVGVFYYYTLRAFTIGGGFSDYTPVNVGRRTIEAPSWISATDGFWDDKVAIEWEPVSGVFSYEVYRGPSADSSLAGSIGTALEASFEDVNAVPGTQYHYFVRARRTEFQSDLLSPFSASDAGYRSTDTPFQPDAMIGSSPLALRGNDQYSLAAAGQVATRVEKKRRAKQWLLELQNDGLLEDEIMGAGTRGNRFFRASYFQVEEGGLVNVTGEMITGTNLNTVLPSEGVEFRLRVKPAGSLKYRTKSKRFILSFTSTNHPDVGDAAAAILKKKKEKKRRRR